MSLRLGLSFGRAALEWRLARRRRPVNVMLSLGDACNARCLYCDIPALDRPGMDTAEIFQLLGQLRSAGTRRLGLWGGEPLLRPDLGAIIDRARALGMWVSMDTNGWLLPRRLPDIAGLSHLVVSLDGDEHGHDAVRGEGSHRKALKGLRAAVEAGLPAWTLTVLHKENLHEVPWILSLAEELGIRAAFQVLHHPPELAGQGAARFTPEPERLRHALAGLLQAREEGRPVANSRRSLRHLLEWKDYGVFSLPQAPPGTPACLAGQLFANVDAAGRLRACSLREGAEAGIPALPDFKVAWDALPPPPCQACLATAFTEYSALFALDPVAVLDWGRTGLLRSSA